MWVLRQAENLRAILLTRRCAFISIFSVFGVVKCIKHLNLNVLQTPSFCLHLNELSLEVLWNNLSHQLPIFRIIMNTLTESDAPNHVLIFHFGISMSTSHFKQETPVPLVPLQRLDAHLQIFFKMKTFIDCAFMTDGSLAMIFSVQFISYLLNTVEIISFHFFIWSILWSMVTYLNKMHLKFTVLDSKVAQSLCRSFWLIHTWIVQTLQHPPPWWTADTPLRFYWKILTLLVLK